MAPDKNWLFFLLALICALQIHGQSTVSRSEGYIGKQIEYFVTAENLSLEEARSGPFQPAGSDVLLIGITHEEIWIRFQYKNTGSFNDFLELSYPILDEVGFYLLDSSGHVVDSGFVGESVPFGERQYETKNFVFDLHGSEYPASEVYLRIASGEQISIPLQVRSLQSIQEDHTLLEFLFGIYAGIVLVMALYNLFIYFSTRDKSYLLYVFYIVSVGIAQAVLQGFAFKYLYPGLPEVAVHATYLVGGLSGISVLLFVSVFLEVKRFNKWAYWLFNIFIAIDILAILIALLGYYQLSYNLINAVAGAGSLTVLVVAVYINYKGFRPAKFFLIAWTVFLTSVVVYVLKDTGIIPYNNITASSIVVGSAIEFVLLSLALADRINILKNEKAELQARELEALQEKEKLVREQNVLLEQKVEERTREIKETNMQLNSALNELKQAQVSLVNAEKMASLGQLTAGIAHEINNPINFVVGSINPLKRDIEDILELLDVLENEAKGSFPPEKLEHIEAMKQQLDIDFTRKEIEDLLKGMEEGSNRTAEIVQGLKNFSRLDEAESKFANIHEGLDATLIILRSMLKERIKVTCDFDENMPDIECYPGKLNQVFSNIISNAAQAIFETKREDGEITIRTHVHENHITVEITDNGPGIPKEIREKIFEPFFTTKPVGDGTGLGLSIVYSIIEQHHGEISVESEPNNGTTFRIKLPKALY